LFPFVLIFDTGHAPPGNNPHLVNTWGRHNDFGHQYQ
jgi:hypothetical protein